MKNNENFCSQCGHALNEDKPDFENQVADKVLAMIAEEEAENEGTEKKGKKKS